MDNLSFRTKPLHRKKELEVIERSIKLREHLFISGPSGSGKTHCINYILHKLKPKFSYINCYIYKTRTAIITKILIDMGIPVARSGPSFDYVHEKLTVFLNKNRVLIILDDFQRLPKKDMAIINDLFGRSVLIVLSFKRSILSKLDRNVFLPIKLEFPVFTREQIADILKKRFDAETGALNQIADYAYTHNGNCRLAVECSKRIKQRWDKIGLDNTLEWLGEIR